MSELIKAEDLADTIGLVATDEFDRMEGGHVVKVLKQLTELRDATDDEFVRLTTDYIEDAARFASYRGNWNHVHVLASAASHMSAKRYAAAGHTSDCLGSTLYDDAYRAAGTRNGHHLGDKRDCTCGRGATGDVLPNVPIHADDLVQVSYGADVAIAGQQVTVKRLKSMGDGVIMVEVVPRTAWLMLDEIKSVRKPDGSWRDLDS